MAVQCPAGAVTHSTSSNHKCIYSGCKCFCLCRDASGASSQCHIYVVDNKRQHDNTRTFPDTAFLLEDVVLTGWPRVLCPTILFDNPVTRVLFSSAVHTTVVIKVPDNHPLISSLRSSMPERTIWPQRWKLISCLHWSSKNHRTFRNRYSQ